MGTRTSRIRPAALPHISPWSTPYHQVDPAASTSNRHPPTSDVHDGCGAGHDQYVKPLKWLVIINEWANHRREKRLRVARDMLVRLQAEGMELHAVVTTGQSHAMQFVAMGGMEAVDADAVMVLGGDGTTSEVINGLCWRAIKLQAQVCAGAAQTGRVPVDGSRALQATAASTARVGHQHRLSCGVSANCGTGVQIPPLALVPVGTSNTLAFCCGINSVADAEKAIKSCRVRRMDILEVSRIWDAEEGGRLACTGHRSWLERALGRPALFAPSAASAATTAPSAVGRADETGIREGCSAFDADAALKCSEPGELRAIACFSAMLVGWGRAAAALTTIESRRKNAPCIGSLGKRKSFLFTHCGQLEMCCAATAHVVENATWLAAVRYVNPVEPIVPSHSDLLAMHETMRALKSGRAQGADGHFQWQSCQASIAHAVLDRDGTEHVLIHHMQTTRSVQDASNSSGAQSIASVKGETGHADNTVRATQVAALPAADPLARGGGEGAGTTGSSVCVSASANLQQATVTDASTEYGGSCITQDPAGLSSFLRPQATIPGTRAPEDVPACVLHPESDGSVPVLAPDSHLQPVVMLQVQSTPYLGHTLPFCPFALVDDGLLDVQALMGCSRANTLRFLADVRAGARHLLRGRRRGMPEAAVEPLPHVRYAQSREIELYTPSQTQLDRWLHGEDVDVVAEAAQGSQGSFTGTAQEDMPARLAAAGAFPVVHADAASAGEPSQACAARAQERRRHGVYPIALSGERSLNIHGELAGFTPCRIRAVHAALPVFVNPDRPSATRL